MRKRVSKFVMLGPTRVTVTERHAEVPGQEFPIPSERVARSPGDDPPSSDRLPRVR